MEFSEFQCPVCNKTFQDGDDVVVCPECGAPHHRECYEQNGHCFYEDKHGAGFSFEDIGKEESDEDVQTLTCPRCGYENDKTAFYCNECGLPLNNSNGQHNTQYNNYQSQNPYGQAPNGFQGMPFGFSVGPMSAFDPLGGLDGEEEIDDNVKVSEAAKFIGKSTQYFLMVFKKIKDFNRSRFNFCAAIFAEVYFLYRKITPLGVAVSLFFIVSNIASAAIKMTPEYKQIYENMQNAIESGTSISIFSPESSFMYVLLGLELSRLVVKILCGIFANRLYYKHCSKKIRKIKDSKPDDLHKTLEQKGGVNLPLAASFYVAGLVISYICNYLVTNYLSPF